MSANPFNDIKSCWVLAGDKVGARHQAEGLAQLLGLNYETIVTHLEAPWCYLPGHWIPNPLQHLRPVLKGPWPDLVISCGRRHAPVAAAIRKASGGKTFVAYIHHPQMPFHHFDAVILAGHDKAPSPLPDNTFVQPLPLHHLSQEKLGAAQHQFTTEFEHLKGPKLAVVIGGKSQAHEFPAETAHKLVEDLSRLHNTTGCSLLITVSRRTPSDSEAILRQAFGNCDYAYFWDGQAPNPYIGILACADHILVTEDSASMISEACYTGKPVYLYEIPGNHQKFSVLYRHVQDKGYARWFTGELTDAVSHSADEQTAELVEFLGKRL